MTVQFKSPNIKAISLVLGENEESVDEMLSGYTDIKIQQFKKNYGINKHYVTSDETYASDLAVLAIKNLQNLYEDDFDCLVVVTNTPDYLFPSTSSIIHKSLNLSQNVVCFDICSFCSGFVKGLFLASNLLSSYKRVLLVCTSAKSKLLNPDDNFIKSSISDSACVCLLESSLDDYKSYFSEYTFSDLALIETKPIGALKKTENNYVTLDNNSFFNKVFEKYPDIFNDLMSVINSDEELDCYFHLPSKFFYNKFISHLNLGPQNCINISLNEFANLDMNNIPLNLILSKKLRGGGRKGVIMGSYGTGISLNILNMHIDFDKLKTSLYCGYRAFV